jgi:hypothetical protein
MRINWNPSPQLKAKAALISEAKEKHTYDDLVEIFELSRAYLVRLKFLGDEVRKEQRGESKNI